MPRKTRCRFIGGYPDCWRFTPEDAPEDAETVTLSLDEYEAVRLLDREGLTQEQAAERMGVARTTVTAIYDSARKKLAQMLVDGRPLAISGGRYQIAERETPELRRKGTDTMRIAVTYENGQIFQHFGHSEHFKLYDVEDGRIVAEQVVDTNGSGHGALAGFLRQAGTDALICGGIGGGAQAALAEAGIKLYGGCRGDADAAARALAAGKLVYNPNVRCDHHDHAHEGGEHLCGHGEHSCGSVTRGGEEAAGGHAGKF